MPGTRSKTVLLAALLALLGLISGCSNTGVEYIPTGGEYTMESAQEAALTANIDDVKDVLTADAPEMRGKRLEELRTKGPGASALADVLTKDFPTETAAVPVLVESATVDGRTAWLVVEAWGDEGGTLVHRRLWVLDKETLEIIGSSSFR